MPKTATYVFVIVAAGMVAGCASRDAYKAYTEAVIKANAYRQQPGITQTFDSQGKLVSQVIVMPDQGVPVAQIKDSEWAAPISTALSLGAMGLSNWAISYGVTSAVKATQPNITNTTNMSSGGHMVGGNLDASATTQSTTSIAEGTGGL